MPDARQLSQRSAMSTLSHPTRPPHSLVDFAQAILASEINEARGGEPHRYRRQDRTHRWWVEEIPSCEARRAWIATYCETPAAAFVAAVLGISVDRQRRELLLVVGHLERIVFLRQ